MRINDTNRARATRSSPAGLFNRAMYVRRAAVHAQQTTCEFDSTTEECRGLSTGRFVECSPVEFRCFRGRFATAIRQESESFSESRENARTHRLPRPANGAWEQRATCPSRICGGTLLLTSAPYQSHDLAEL